MINPFHPRATPPAKLPSVTRIAAAKERDAMLISQDGEHIYKMLYGEWRRADWLNGEYGSWWGMGTDAPPVEVVVL